MSTTTRMGLTNVEIEWLRANQDGAGKALVTQYQMIVSAPQDPGARGIFEAMRDDWRRSAEYPFLSSDTKGAS